MVTLSRILVWRIPQTEEPIGLTVLEVAVRQTEPAYIHASAEQKTFKSLLLTSVTVMPGGITIIPPGGEKAVSERLSHSPNATQLERVCDSKLPDQYSSPSLWHLKRGNERALLSNLRSEQPSETGSLWIYPLVLRPEDSQTLFQHRVFSFSAVGWSCLFRTSAHSTQSPGQCNRFVFFLPNLSLYIQSHSSIWGASLVAQMVKNLLII